MELLSRRKRGRLQRRLMGVLKRGIQGAGVTEENARDRGR